MKKMSKNALAKQLQSRAQPELVDMIMRLYSAIPEAADYLIIELGGEDYELELLAKAKKKVRNEFFPARGLGRLSLSIAKAAIKDFGRVSKNPANYIDLQLYYVECGVEYTNTYGDIDERFYNSMESVYQDVIDMLENMDDEEMIRRFHDRLRAAVDDTSNIGWGFHDYLTEAYYQVFPEE